ncbi:MAG: inner membrane protein YhjD, partial [Sciscionella sp.]
MASSELIDTAAAGERERPAARGDAVSRLIASLRRRPWIDHMWRANEAFGERNGNQYGAAITYFSLLSLAPLILV